MKCLAIAKKDIIMYYSKGPVVIFGILLPLFLFLAFWIGRNLPMQFLMAGLVSMTAFFSSTSVSPAIAPWEGQMKTLERLIACPITIKTILLGDIIASLTFGVILSLIPIAISLAFGITANIFELLLAIFISSFCFSCLGLLFSAYPTNLPSTVMMISSLIRFPLIFISGIFIPLSDLPSVGRLIAIFSPLTYLTDIARDSFGLKPYFPVYLDFASILVFSAIFLVASIRLHNYSLLKRL